MKTLMVYYSLNGNTEFAVKSLSAMMDADTLRIEPKKTYPDKGFMKFVVGGFAVTRGEKPELLPYSVNLDEYDAVVIAGPVWASSFAPAMGTFLEQNRGGLKNKKVAALFCSAGGRDDKAFEKLKSAIGIDGFFAELALTDPKKRPDPENADRMRAFAEKFE